MKIEVARSAWKVAHSRAPGPGITERASEGPGKAVKRAFVENSTLASVRNCPLSAKSRPSADLTIVSCGKSSEWDEK
ncbi:hypothetical protein THAOC_23576 [Thalassiosira oceanica]|uniref:Uncharacterized protein n=1 Tax=Thalassiosira oceanica TaxID=159749 RepID=K0RU51_THAOC|nr:hypothetical protein THAOC_23576 [Thalassiosira oceanica]|eukprot:EJK56520.1 hypothetical protein THAOC_23576 [Thalassiosira oceanica]